MVVNIISCIGKNIMIKDTLFPKVKHDMFILKRVMTNLMK